MMDSTALTLSRDELITLTGYKPYAKQLEALHAAGFHRARISPATGKLILERAHYQAVCAGLTQEVRPKVRPPKVRHAQRLAAQGL